MEVKSTLTNLEVLVVQQSKNLQQLCDSLGQLAVPGVLDELKALTVVPQEAGHLKDSASQTSPSLTQSLHFTKQEKSPSEEPATWQAQASSAGNPSRSSQRPGECGAWDEGAESDIFQKAALPTDGLHRGNGHVKNKTMQTYCRNWVMTTRSLNNHFSSLPSQKAGNDQGLMAQGASQLDLNKFEGRVKTVCPEYGAESKCSFDSFEQSATEQKGRACRKTWRGKKKQPKRSKRGRLLAREQEEQTSRKACAFRARHHCPQSLVCNPQGPLICWPTPRSSTKSTCHILGKAGETSKTARAVQGNLLQSSQCSSTDSSSQGDQQINWFSDLSLENLEPPLCKKGGKNLLCDPDFDSSDDNF